MFRQKDSKLKKFFVLLIGTSMWLFLLIAIPVWFSIEGERGDTFFIVSYLVVSFCVFWYFSTRNELVEDKSFTSVTRAIKGEMKNVFRVILYSGVAIVVIALIASNTGSISGNKQELESDAYYKGDMSNTGGTPTYRYSDTPSYSDNYYTTDDESNNQAVGFYGTDTMYACNGSSGNCYDLDVDSDGENIERLYFEKGGWVDIDYSDCEDGFCYAEDENGNEWELEAY